MPRHYYDEVRLLTRYMPAGSTISLRKDEDDRGEYYIIDLIDIELVPSGN